MQDRQRMLGSMRVRILAAVVALLAGSSAVSIILLRGVLLDRLDEEITIGLARETEEFQLLAAGLNPRTGAPFVGHLTSEVDLDDLEAVFEIYFAREVPDEGETLLALQGGRLLIAEAAPDAAPPDALGDAIDYWLTLDAPEMGALQIGLGEVRYSVLPLAGRAGPGLLAVVNFPASERAEINNAVRTQALIQFGMIALASLLGLGLAGRVLRPLGSLADTAQRISETDLTRRIPVWGQDEASRIARAFNDMLGRLERAFATQRQFLDDVNHELRAPLTVIRGHVEVLDLLSDPAERRETTELIVGEIERMTRIVDELLLLARSERPGFLSIAPVDLAELTREVYRKAVVLCDRPWSLEECAQSIIEADAQRLTQAMVQLAANVCQHTPPGCTVRIGSAVRDDHVLLWVHDDGPGVRAEDAERIFRRFVKGSNSGRGSGLGLSIVAAIAEAHGGAARLAPSGRGARFEIVLPRREPQPAAVAARRLPSAVS